MQNTLRIFATFFLGASLVILAPTLAYAHGDEDDGHVEETPVVVASDGHTDHAHGAGESALLVAFSTKWWGLLFTALGLTTLLSYAVWSYLQVGPKKVYPADSVPSPSHT